jgi:hypothetical protein
MKSFRALLTIVALFVLSAAPLSAQAGKVICMDGTKSVAGRGACSSHGGIQTAKRKAELKADAKAAKAAKVADAKAAKAAEKSEKADKKVAAAEKKEDRDAHGATAECKDHTYSHAKSHQGACSGHGGVAKFFSGK